jgi:hypothetical protein
MKKCNSSFIIVCFLLVFCSISFAQDGGGGFDGFGHQSFQSQKVVIPPAPNAASLGNFGDYSVSNYTGALNLSIPIYTLQGKGISHSISLGYNGSGSKVTDVPSWTGLGWNLNAGGVISRSAMGNPDSYSNYYSKGEFFPEYCGSVNYFDCEQQQVLSATTYDEIKNQINKGLWDISNQSELSIGLNEY